MNAISKDFYFDGILSIFVIRSSLKISLIPENFRFKLKK